MTTGIVSGILTKPDNSPARGLVRITPAFTHGINTTTNMVYTAETMAYKLDGRGYFIATLQATDDPQFDPQNFTYGITFDLIGMDVAAFSFSLPGGSSLDLADITPVPSRAGDLTGRVFVQSTEPSSPQVDDIWIKI